MFYKRLATEASNALTNLFKYHHISNTQTTCPNTRWKSSFKGSLFQEVVQKKIWQSRKPTSLKVRRTMFCHIAYQTPETWARFSLGHCVQTSKTVDLIMQFNWSQDCGLQQRTKEQCWCSRTVQVLSDWKTQEKTKQKTYEFWISHYKRN